MELNPANERDSCMATSEQILAEWKTGRLSPLPTHIPLKWELLRLTSVAKLESGHTPSRRQLHYWEGDIPWISLHDSGGLDVPEIFATSQTIGPIGLANSSARLLPKGTVVFSRTATIGKVTLMGREMATSQDFANYICGDRVHNHFLVHLFRYMSPEWKRLMAGSTHNTIYMPIFRELQVLLPPKSEQEHIAKALSDMDALIEALEHLVAKKRNIKEGAMQELLTGKQRLPGFSGEWRAKKLEELADIRSGGTPSTTQSQFWDGEVLWCTPTDITALKGYKYLSRTSRKISIQGLKCSSAEMIPANSIVMTSRATIGECAVNTVPVSTNQGFKNFVPFENVDVDFLYYLLQTKKQDFISLCGGSTFLEIGKTKLAPFKLSIPATKAEQSAVALVLSNMDEEIAALEAKLDKARQLKQGMMHDLLTGRIRLV